MSPSLLSLGFSFRFLLADFKWTLSGPWQKQGLGAHVLN